MAKRAGTTDVEERTINDELGEVFIPESISESAADSSELKQARRAAKDYDLSQPIKNDGGFVVGCVAMPGVTAWGKTKDEAEKACRKSVEEAIATLINLGMELPKNSRPPSTVMRSVRLNAVMDADIQRICRENGVTFSEFVRMLFEKVLED